MRVHIERLRRALVLLDVGDPDAHVADLLSGSAPFVTSEPFMDLSTDDLQPVPPGTAPDPDDAADAPAVGHGTHALSEPVLAEEIDLAGALGNLGRSAAPEGGSPVDLDDVFRSIRAETELDPPDDGEDFASQYVTLASRYIETGLLEDAILSLETAARSPAHRFEAAAMLGRLYLAQGEPRKGIEWLQQATRETAATPEDRRAVLFDLGVLLDEAGEPDGALAIFLELQADAGDYHDVPSRIDRLARVKSGG